MSISSIFNIPVKSKRIAKAITLTSLAGWHGGIKELEKGGVTTHEKRAMVLAQNRARASLNRKNLSLKVRRRFEHIAGEMLPKITRHQRRRR